MNNIPNRPDDAMDLPTEYILNQTPNETTFIVLKFVAAGKLISVAQLPIHITGYRTCDLIAKILNIASWAATGVSPADRPYLISTQKSRTVIAEFYVNLCEIPLCATDFVSFVNAVCHGEITTITTKGLQRKNIRPYITHVSDINK